MARALWLVTICAACSSATSPVHTPAPAPATQAVRPEVASPTVAEIPTKELDAWIADAYRRGDADRFSALVRRLVALGHQPVRGLGTLAGYFVHGHQTSAWVSHQGRSWFFKTATGEPFAYLPVALRRRAPNLAAVHFITDDGGLYQPDQGVFADIQGLLIALHPDGRSAYFVDESCRVHAWDIARHVATALDAVALWRCDPWDFRDAAVSSDGRWLVTRWGKWNVQTKAWAALPFLRTAREGWEPAVGLDGRYVARIMRNPAASEDDSMTAVVIQLHDLSNGSVRTANKTLSLLSNRDPLSFHAQPPRVCVRNYGQYAFAVPSLQLLETCNDDLGDNDLQLQNRFAARVCAVGPVLVPRANCE
jgi:hypothetical protein